MGMTLFLTDVAGIGFREPVYLVQESQATASALAVVNVTLDETRIEAMAMTEDVTATGWWSLENAAIPAWLKMMLSIGPIVAVLQCIFPTSFAAGSDYSITMSHLAFNAGERRTGVDFRIMATNSTPSAEGAKSFLITLFSDDAPLTLPTATIVILDTCESL